MITTFQLLPAMCGCSLSYQFKNTAFPLNKFYSITYTKISHASSLSIKYLHCPTYFTTHLRTLLKIPPSA